MSRRTSSAGRLAYALYLGASLAAWSVVIQIAMGAPDAAFPSWLNVDLGRALLAGLWWFTLVLCGASLLLAAMILARLIAVGIVAETEGRS